MSKHPPMSEEQKAELLASGRRLKKSLMNDANRLDVILLNIVQRPTQEGYEELNDFISELEEAPYTELVKND